MTQESLTSYLHRPIQTALILDMEIFLGVGRVCRLSGFGSPDSDYVGLVVSGLIVLAFGTTNL